MDGADDVGRDRTTGKKMLARTSCHGEECCEKVAVRSTKPYLRWLCPEGWLGFQSCFVGKVSEVKERAGGEAEVWTWQLEPSLHPMNPAEECQGGEKVAS